MERSSAPAQSRASLLSVGDGFLVDEGGVQHFLFVSPKRKRWQKKKATGGISNFPPDPLKATRKTTSVFLDLSCTAYRPGGTNDMHCTRKPNGTAHRPSPTRKFEFLRRIPNNPVGDGLRAVPLYAPRRIRTNCQARLAAVLPGPFKRNYDQS